MGAVKPEAYPHLCLGPNAGYELIGRCKCGQQRRLAIAPLARKYGKFTFITYLQQLLVCRTCGQKGDIRLKLVRWDQPDPRPQDRW
jgi:hypothetical protein